jgi:serine/threonine protein kinase
MDETEKLSQTEGSQPRVPGSRGSSDQTKHMPGTDGSQPRFEGSRGSPNGDPPKIGRYTILGRLGQGGFGWVYLAHDDDLDRQDANFFLELFPGPRDRGGLPESIRFWKSRVEQIVPDETFRVGLIYGPSGCGKSSPVKAGSCPGWQNMSTRFTSRRPPRRPNLD